MEFREMSAGQVEGGDQRKVVGGEQGCPGPVHAEARKAQAAVVVEMIQVEDREDPRISAGIPEKLARVDRLKGLTHGDPVK